MASICKRLAIFANDLEIKPTSKGPPECQGSGMLGKKQTYGPRHYLFQAQECRRELLIHIQ